MMKHYFITGTDTNVGKTLTSAILTLALNAHYWKPIQSGLDDDLSDADRVRELTGLTATRFLPSSYALRASLSPDQAASLENITIDLEQCKLPVLLGNAIVEGAGGVYVPLNNQHCMLDLMQKLNLPIIIVTRGTLGTINHTVLTLDTLQRAGLTIHGIVINGELNLQNKIAIEKWGKTRVLLHIPFFNSLTPITVQNWTKENHALILEKFA